MLLEGKAEQWGRDEYRILTRMNELAETSEPDFERMWWGIRRRTVDRRSRQIRFWRGVAAVVLPVLMGVSVLYVLREQVELVQESPDGKEIGYADRSVRLILNDGQVLEIPKTSAGEVLNNGQVAVRQDSTEGMAYVLTDKDEKELIYHTIEIPVGADYRLTLSDGSIVYLNSSSKLTYPVAFVGNERKVFLEGEGYFEVRSDEDHPFRVEVGKTIVEAVGTVFNINAYPEKDGVEATLVRGKVNVESGRHQVMLEPGQQARCGKEQIEVHEVDTREYICWKNGMFIFNKMTLEDIMIQMQRWYGVHVFFQQEHLKEYVFTGMIDKHLPLQEVFRTIEKTADVQFYLKENTVVIK